MGWGWDYLSHCSPVDVAAGSAGPGSVSCPSLPRWHVSPLAVPRRVGLGHAPACQKAVPGPQEMALGCAVGSWYGFGHVSSSLFPRAHSLLFVGWLSKRGTNVKTHVLCLENRDYQRQAGCAVYVHKRKVLICHCAPTEETFSGFCWMPGSSRARCTSAQTPSLSASSASVLASGQNTETGVNMFPSGRPLFFLDWFLTLSPFPPMLCVVFSSRLPGNRLSMEPWVDKVFRRQQLPPPRSCLLSPYGCLRGTGNTPDVSPGSHWWGDTGNADTPQRQNTRCWCCRRGPAPHRGRGLAPAPPPPPPTPCPAAPLQH